MHLISRDKNSMIMLSIFLLLLKKKCFKMKLLGWWADISIYKFLILTHMAGLVLAAQPTSAEMKRLFSISNRVLTKLRSALSYYHVNELVYLHNWLKNVMLLQKKKIKPM